MTAPALDAVAVLVPVKAFDQAKLRLAPALDAPARALLAREMASNVVRAAAGLPVSVVCDDDAVAEWALGEGASVIWRPGRGLNGAVGDGVASLAASGFSQVIVAHADLPHALDFAAVAGFDGVTLVPDRRNDGTNAACVPAAAGFEFAYGPRSFVRHCREARERGITLRVVREPRLAWDVDVPDDLAAPGWLTR
jgi:2-phospho-L-lactate/phosphoenolpyruvate guanylyltransferase